MNKTQQDSRPWYKEPWPWLLMAGPAIVIVAGVITAWLAFTRADPLVTEDYYKKGLQAGHTIAASERAVALGLTAELKFSESSLSVQLKGQQDLVLPSSMHITISHPTRAGLDQNLSASLAQGSYTTPWHLQQAGHWIVLIEDDLQTWRLLGKVMLPTAAAVEIKATP